MAGRQCWTAPRWWSGVASVEYRLAQPHTHLEGGVGGMEQAPWENIGSAEEVAVVYNAWWVLGDVPNNYRNARLEKF